mmetsp:Transcript_6169/g.8928  ORF Transcript_6169/g.8928 Transcript_6169/m.8928 type:complete len:209 (+) Transcript_6169:1461-2087(+)
MGSRAHPALTCRFHPTKSPGASNRFGQMPARLGQAKLLCTSAGGREFQPRHGLPRGTDGGICAAWQTQLNVPKTFCLHLGGRLSTRLTQRCPAAVCRRPNTAEHASSRRQGRSGPRPKCGWRAEDQFLHRSVEYRHRAVCWTKLLFLAKNRLTTADQCSKTDFRLDPAWLLWRGDRFLPVPMLPVLHASASLECRAMAVSIQILGNSG